LVITHYVSLSSLVLMAGFMTMMLVVGINGLGAFAVIPDAVLLEMYIVTFAIVLMAYIRHLPNIKRLLEHNERKTYVFKKNKPEE
ncbi:MAG: glycerol-3-phosphate acyltransferase, partial [Lachnospiraceae bacterium]|nr:glycerol-3-phosphate acyltransferase [Lachnospiraceae bacterium]